MRVTNLNKMKATTVRTEEGVIFVRYHLTDIVKIEVDRITLDTRGYFTSTTKRRMNQAAETYELGYVVYQRKGKWYVNYKNEVFQFGSGKYNTYAMSLTR